MSATIREEITKRLGVEPICINSALVSAQNRQRLYWTNIPGVQQPEDRGILLRDILETGVTPVNTTEDGKARCLRATYYKDGIRNLVGNTVDRKTCVAEPLRISYSSTFEVRNGLITIKDKQYPIKLQDGFYIIRKLTVRECMKLQTVPEWYEFPVSDTQAYKMLGNGWTVDVISHILSYCPGIVTSPLDVLSMYDGMACGHLALDKLGAHIGRYRATEIDKYAIKTGCHNFPDIEQLGDAFQVRWWAKEAEYA